jgi:polyisoprenoid-binding protein YceI
MNTYALRLRKTHALTVLCFALTLPLPALRAQETVLELDPAQTHIQFTLNGVLGSVQGSFQLKAGTIRFNPTTGNAGGLVVVDVTSGKTDNPGRDRKMHKDVLESRKYPEATFTPSRVFGRLEAQGDSAIELDGTFKLRGIEHEISLATTARRDGNQLTSSTHLVIPYVDWGLKNPSTLFIRVGNTVDIDIKTAGRLTQPPAPQ